jgi:hypothetical protein
MSDTISRVYDDYDAYEALCEELGIEPLPLHRLNDSSKSFYDHEHELREQHDLYKTYWGTYKKNKNK